MRRRLVLCAGGPSRLALLSGALRAAPANSPAALIIESGMERIPLVVLAPHRINSGGALLADADGEPVAREGDQLELVGGFAAEDDSRHPAFLASTVTLISP